LQSGDTWRSAKQAHRRGRRRSSVARRGERPTPRRAGARKFSPAADYACVGGGIASRPRRATTSPPQVPVHLESDERRGYYPRYPPVASDRGDGQKGTWEIQGAGPTCPRARRRPTHSRERLFRPGPYQRMGCWIACHPNGVRLAGIQPWFPIPRRCWQVSPARELIQQMGESRYQLGGGAKAPRSRSR
jgi:hypothetical protein